ncbi:MAG: hypothetical protein ABSB96_03265 [Gaiellaceae bacterium]
MASNWYGEQSAIEHGSSKSSRFLHANRFRIALIIVIVEALLVAFNAIALWLAVVIAAGVLVLYLLGRHELSGSARELAWIVAASQAVGVLVFVLTLVAIVLVIVALVVLALAALGALLIERR